MSGSEARLMIDAVATPDLCDEQGDGVCVLDYQWQRFGLRSRFAGPVTTIACCEDNSRVGEAVAEPGEGRVLLVDGQGSLQRSLLGDRLAAKASENGWAGVVVVGAIRDVEVIDDIDIGVLALGVCPRKTEKRDQGDRDIVLRLREVSVSPGDWLYADRNGVVVSPQPVHL
jgi:regulator of ribonuclease activity A